VIRICGIINECPDKGQHERRRINVIMTPCLVIASFYKNSILKGENFTHHHMQRCGIYTMFIYYCTSDFDLFFSFVSGKF
jgi:hypothetical protein